MINNKRNVIIKNKLNLILNVVYRKGGSSNWNPKKWEARIDQVKKNFEKPGLS
jgi:hypothetical protein